MTKIKTLPNVPFTLERDLKTYLEVLKEAVEVRLGYRGDKLDRAVTFRDINDDAGSLYNNLVQLPGGGGTIPGIPDYPWDDTTPPDRPTGVQVIAAPSYNIITWDRSTQSHVNGAEIWRHTIDDYSLASLVGTDTGIVFTDPVTPGDGTIYYYWVRFVTYSAGPSPFHAVNGAKATGSRLTDSEIANLDILKLVLEVGKTAAQTLIGPNDILDSMVDTVAAEKLYVATGTIARAIIGDAHIENAMINTLAADKIFAQTGTLAEAFIDDADITNAMIGDLIQSSIFNANTGWSISKSGGIIATSILIRGVNGETLLSSGGVVWAGIIGNTRPEDGATASGDDALNADPGFDRTHALQEFGLYWVASPYLTTAIVSGTSQVGKLQASNGNETRAECSTFVPTSQGQRFYARCRLQRHLVATTKVVVKIREYDENFNYLTSTPIFTMTGTSGDIWYLLDGKAAVTHADTSYVRFYIGIDNDDTSGHVYIDYAKFYAVPVVEWGVDIDGDGIPDDNANETGGYLGIEKINRLPAICTTLGDTPNIGAWPAAGGTQALVGIYAPAGWAYLEALGGVNFLPSYSYHGKASLGIAANGNDGYAFLASSSTDYNITIQDADHMLFCFAAAGSLNGGYDAVLGRVMLRFTEIGAPLGYTDIQPTQVMRYSSGTWVLESGQTFTTETNGWAFYCARFDMTAHPFRGFGQFRLHNLGGNGSQLYFDSLQAYKAYRDNSLPPSTYMFPSGGNAAPITPENVRTFIKDLSVNTLQIGDNAVTVPRWVQGPSINVNYSNANNTYVTILSTTVVLSSASAKLGLQFTTSKHMTILNPSGYYIRVVRDLGTGSETVLMEGAFYIYWSIGGYEWPDEMDRNPQVLDETHGGGTHTYHLQIKMHIFGLSAMEVKASLVATEMKK